MSIIDKLMGKSDEQIFKEKVRKDIDKKAKQSMSVAEYYSILGSCKDTFETTIRVERLNALERRERRIGDAKQKSRIYDAAVGLIAIEEAEIELRGTVQASDLAKAQKKLGFVVKQIGKINPDTSISKKDLKNLLGMDFDDSNATETFVERAELVDEQFVEYLIQGYSMEECLEKKLPNVQTPLVGATYDFSSGNADADAAYIDDVLRKNVEKR